MSLGSGKTLVTKLADLEGISSCKLLASTYTLCNALIPSPKKFFKKVGLCYDYGLYNCETIKKKSFSLEK